MEQHHASHIRVFLLSAGLHLLQHLHLPKGEWNIIMRRSLDQQLRKHFHYSAGGGSSTGGLLCRVGCCWSPQERLVQEVCAALDQA